MIRRNHNGDWFLIPQPEHARLSGEIARSWGGGGFFPPEPRDEVIYATAEHDNGWREWEERPKLNDAGQPAHFPENPLSEVFDLFRLAVDRLYEQGFPYGAAMVSRHGVNWSNDLVTGVRNLRPITPELKAEIRDFGIEAAKRQEEICREIREMPQYAEAVTPEGMHRNGRFVWAMDMLSLIPCCGWSHINRLREVPRGSDYGELGVKLVEDSHVLLRPWPFESPSLEFQVQGRRLPASPFRNIEEFHGVLEKTAVSELTVRYSQN